jgi:hypothetical protein
MTHKPSFDASIPVLTEVFQDQPARAESPEAPAGAVEGWTQPEWELLERRLCERILHQLQGRVDFALEQRLRDSMEEALQHAMAGLTDEIRRSLQQTIEKIVVRAVAQELTHLQTLNK